MSINDSKKSIEEGSLNISNNYQLTESYKRSSVVSFEADIEHEKILNDLILNLPGEEQSDV